MKCLSICLPFKQKNKRPQAKRSDFSTTKQAGSYEDVLNVQNPHVVTIRDVCRFVREHQESVTRGNVRLVLPDSVRHIREGAFSQRVASELYGVDLSFFDFRSFSICSED